MTSFKNSLQTFGVTCASDSSCNSSLKSTAFLFLFQWCSAKLCCTFSWSQCHGLSACFKFYFIYFSSVQEILHRCQELPGSFLLTPCLPGQSKSSVDFSVCCLSLHPSVIIFFTGLFPWWACLYSCIFCWFWTAAELVIIFSSCLEMTFLCSSSSLNLSEFLISYLKTNMLLPRRWLKP